MSMKTQAYGQSHQASRMQKSLGQSKTTMTAGPSEYSGHRLCVDTYRRKGEAYGTLAGTVASDLFMSANDDVVEAALRRDLTPDGMAKNEPRSHMGHVLGWLFGHTAGALECPTEQPK